MRQLFLVCLCPLLVAVNPTHQQSARQAITAQQGCYKVTFQYEEVEALQEGYELQPPKRSEIIEWIGVIEESDERVVLQHVLVTPPRIKHWEQIWTYEGTSFDVHSGPNQWTRHELSAEDAAGAWVQEVRGVADNPRYACSAPWMLDGETAWTCRTWAPKPRRDKKRDYAVLQRTNTHRIHAAGWVHEQANIKLQVDSERVVEVVREVGRNTYDRIDDSECAEAAIWWQERQATWDQVQRAWDDVSATHQTYSVDSMGGAFPLWVRLFWLARKPQPESKHERIYQRASKLLGKKILASDLLTAAYDVSLPRTVPPQPVEEEQAATPADAVESDLPSPNSAAQQKEP